MLRLLDLPRDIVFHLLLHHFTMQEVIQLRVICQEVYHMVQHCLARRRSLKLFFFSSDIQQYTHELYSANFEYDPVLRLHPPGPANDDLILDPTLFQNRVVDLLVEGLFPNVRHLIIYIGARTNWYDRTKVRYPFQDAITECISYMLSKMRSTLTDLSLFGNASVRKDYCKTVQSHQICRRLIQQINKMDHLRRLDLGLRDMIIYSDNNRWSQLDDERQDNIRDTLPPSVTHAQTALVLEPRVLSQLERIYVRHQCQQFLRVSFRHLGSNLKEIYLFELEKNVLDLEKWDIYVPGTLYRALLRYPSAVSITHLKLNQDLVKLPTILPQFANLKSLDLANIFAQTSLSLFELLHTLSRNCCPLLRELKLAQFGLNWVNSFDQLELIQLNRIKRLQMSFSDSPILSNLNNENVTINTFVRAFAYIFPNLKQLTLKNPLNYFPIDNITDQFGPMKQLRLLSVGIYTAKSICHHLLSDHYRKRHIETYRRDCGDNWNQNAFLAYSKDLNDCWNRMN